MSKSKATVSVALPVYNGAAHLREALQSFRHQKYRNFQLTICDNASTDATPEIAEEFARSDSRFIHQRQEDFLNARDNFTRAYQLSAPGNTYFLWACDDNIWDSKFLSCTVEYMESNPDCSLCGFHLYSFDGDVVHSLRRIDIPPLQKKWRMLHALAGVGRAVSIYGLIRRSAIDAISVDLRGIDDYPDRHILLQLRTYGHFHVVPEVLLGFRGGGISTTKDDPWVKTVIDLKFGDAELALLESFDRLSELERVLIGNTYAYHSLRHNIAGTASRWWLTPAHALAAIMNRVRPSAWHVGAEGLERRDP